MTKLFMFVCILAIALMSRVQAGMTDISCDDKSRLLATLTNVLGAKRLGSGLRDPDTMLEIWVTPHSGEWVIVQNYANGTSCIVAMGDYWETAGTDPT